MIIEYPIVSQDAAGVVTRALPARTPTSHTHVVSDITDFPSLADVATSGSFTDLDDLPNDLAGYGITDAQSAISVSANSLLGNNTGSAASPVSLSATQVRALLGLATTDSPTFAGVTATGAVLCQSVLAAGTSSGVIDSTSGTGFNARLDWNLGLQLKNNSAVRWGSGNSSLSNHDLLLLRDGPGIIAQRNGTNAQISRIYKTFQAANNFETFEIDASSDASNYRIGSRIGSAGGTTRGLQLGAYNAAGAWTSWLSFNSSGVPTFSTNGTLSVASGEISAFSIVGTSRLRIGVGTTFQTNTSGVTTTGYLGFAASNATGGPDVAFTRISSTSIELNNGTAGTVRDLSMRDITLVPSSSRTLATNGQFSIEMASNTAGNLVYRGSDGTTRRMALTFS